MKQNSSAKTKMLNYEGTHKNAQWDGASDCSRVPDYTEALYPILWFYVLYKFC